MKNYKDLEIYQIAFDLAKRIHFASLRMPKFELYEQGSQTRRSSKAIKDTIAEGFGRSRYKADFIRYLIFAQASHAETINHLESLKITHPDIEAFESLLTDYKF